MKSLKTGFASLLALLLVCGCAHLFGTRDLVLPLERLQATLDQRFPLNQRYLELFDLRISRPRLSLQPDTNRVVTSLDAQFLPTLFGQPWNGSISVSGELKIDAGRNAVIFTAPRIERFVLDGVEPRLSDKLARFAGVLAEQVLRDVPVYTFRPDDFRYAGMAFVPATIRTRADALVVSFAPAN